MDQQASHLLQKLTNRYPFDLELDWPEDAGTYMPASLMPLYINTRANILQTLCREELSHNDKKALLPFAEAYIESFIDSGSNIGHDTNTSPAFLTVVNHLLDKHGDDLSFQSRTCSVAAALNLIIFLDIVKTNSYNNTAPLPRANKLSRYNPYYLIKVSEFFGQWSDHLGDLVDAQDALSTASLFSERAVTLKLCYELIKHQDKNEMAKSHEKEVNELRKRLSSAQELQSVQLKSSPVDFRHERGSRRLRRFAIKQWEDNGQSFSSRAEAARRIAPLLRDYAESEQITPLAPTNEVRQIQDWIRNYEKSKPTPK